MVTMKFTQKIVDICLHLQIVPVLATLLMVLQLLPPQKLKDTLKLMVASIVALKLTENRRRVLWEKTSMLHLIPMEAGK